MVLRAGRVVLWVCVEFVRTKWLSLVGLLSKLRACWVNGLVMVIIVLVVVVPKGLHTFLVHLCVMLLMAWLAVVVRTSSKPDILGPVLGLQWILALELAIVDPTPPMTRPGVLCRNM